MATSLTKAALNDAVARHLRQDFARILVSQTVGQALDDLRQHPPQGASSTCMSWTRKVTSKA